MAAAADMIALAGTGEAVIELIYVGEADAVPAVDPPENFSGALERTARPGKVVDEIIAAAEQLPADLVVMATRGHQGLLDALRGSTTEQVVRRAPCPVLAVPAA